MIVRSDLCTEKHVATENRNASMNFWKGKRVVVTGGTGFLGSHLVARLKEIIPGPAEVFVPRRKDHDLVSYENCVRLYDDARPDIVIHLAARVGGIGANRSNPGQFFYDNLMMGTQLMEIGRQRAVEKFVAIGTICGYPKSTPVPFREEAFWNGYPEETNAPYGLAKKMLLVQSQAYRMQYGFNSIFLLPVNLYGPGDHFDPNTSHVIPGIIRKCVDAVRTGATEIVLWGTGNPSREFLHVLDAVEGILLASEHYNGSEPVNLGSGMEIRIRDLALLIARITGYRGQIIWDTSMPDGQARRSLDFSKAERLFGFRATRQFEEGLQDTIDWYKKNELMPELNSR